jgi:site-specific recombinase XerC
LSALRRFFDWLAEQYSISGNPTRGITVVDTSASEPSRSDFLSRQELETLVSVASEPSETGPRDRALVLTIVYASLRRGETAALNIEDVRPLGRHWVIDLPRTSTARGGYVKIPDLVATAVQNTAASYDADEGPLWRSFSNRNRGARMSPDALYKLVRRLGRKADVGPVDIEMLRQSGLRLASKAGARVTHLQDQARLEHRASAARYADGDESSARLEKSATDFLKLDV